MPHSYVSINQWSIKLKWLYIPFAKNLFVLNLFHVLSVVITVKSVWCYSVLYVTEKRYVCSFLFLVPGNVLRIVFFPYRMCPIFQVSNVTGENLDLMKMFLNLLSTRLISDVSAPAEFQIDDTFSVPVSV